jgi:hypothetical protein
MSRFPHGHKTILLVCAAVVVYTIALGLFTNLVSELTDPILKQNPLWYLLALPGLLAIGAAALYAQNSLVKERGSQAPTLVVVEPESADTMPRPVKFTAVLLWLQAALLTPLWAYLIKMAVWTGALAAEGWETLGGGSFTLAFIVIGGSAAAAATLQVRAAWPRSLAIGSTSLAAVSIAAQLAGGGWPMRWSLLLLAFAVAVAILVCLSRQPARSWFDEPPRTHDAANSGTTPPQRRLYLPSVLAALVAAFLTMTIALLVLNIAVGHNSWEGPLFGS